MSEQNEAKDYLQGQSIVDMRAELGRRADVIYYLEGELKFWMGEGEGENLPEQTEWQNLISIEVANRTTKQVRRLKELLALFRRMDAYEPELRKNLAEKDTELDRLRAENERLLEQVEGLQIQTSGQDEGICLLRGAEADQKQPQQRLDTLQVDFDKHADTIVALTADLSSEKAARKKAEADLAAERKLFRRYRQLVACEDHGIFEHVNKRLEREAAETKEREPDEQNPTVLDDRESTLYQF